MNLEKFEDEKSIEFPLPTYRQNIFIIINLRISIDVLKERDFNYNSIYNKASNNLDKRSFWERLKHPRNKNDRQLT